MAATLKSKKRPLKSDGLPSAKRPQTRIGLRKLAKSYPIATKSHQRTQKHIAITVLVRLRGFGALSLASAPLEIASDKCAGDEIVPTSALRVAGNPQ